MLLYKAVIFLLAFWLKTCWYSKTCLKMNLNKTRRIFFATPIFKNWTETLQIAIDDTIFDRCLSFEHHIKLFCSRLIGTLSYLNRVKTLFTERIACILCMHLGACRFFTHPTALMHLKSILSKCIQLHFIFLAHTRMGSH